MAALADVGPVLLLLMFAAGLAEFLRLGPMEALTVALAVYVAYHAAFNVLWDGETPGRRAVQIRLVSSKGDQLSLARAILRPVARAAWMATFIVIAVRARSPAFLVIPIVVDGILMSSLKWRQTTADFLCGTLVVNAPAVQPHRAPAGPMYSASDAEFGYAPRRRKS